MLFNVLDVVYRFIKEVNLDEFKGENYLIKKISKS